MDLLTEFAKLILPAAAVLYAMYLTVRAFLRQEMEKKAVEIKLRHAETITPARLQAYERMCLFLERITPNNLLVRLNDGSYTAGQFRSLLLNEIREEYNHNLSQQLYMSDEAWDMVKNAMQEVMSVINKSAEEVDPESKSIELSRKIFEKMLEKETDPISKALTRVKDEIRILFA